MSSTNGSGRRGLHFDVSLCICLQLLILLDGRELRETGPVVTSSVNVRHMPHGINSLGGNDLAAVLCRREGVRVVLGGDFRLDLLVLVLGRARTLRGD